MPTSTSVIDEMRALGEKRLGELSAETKRVERALSELNGAEPARRRPGRPRGSTTSRPAAAPARKARTRKGKPTRADQAVKLVEKEPGISASKIAKEMKIKPNYLYRVLGSLEKEKRVTKKGRQYFPAK